MFMLCMCKKVSVYCVFCIQVTLTPMFNSIYLCILHYFYLLLNIPFVLISMYLLSHFDLSQVVSCLITSKPQKLTSCLILVSRNVRETVCTQDIECVTSATLICPDSPNFAHCNQCSMSQSLNHFCQYITCPTRRGPVICSIKGAYKSSGSSGFTRSLFCSYKSALKKGKIVHKIVPVWTDGSLLEVQESFECTDWDIFKNSC